MLPVSLLRSLLPLLLYGANVPERGEHAEYWDNRSVIFAQVTAVEKHDPQEDLFAYLVTLQPKATLTGKFDPALEPEIKVKFPLPNPLVSNIRRPPAVGANAIVLIRQYEGAYYVSYHKIAYLPEPNAAFIEVKDFADPKVDEVLTSLRIFRARKFPSIRAFHPDAKLPLNK